MILFRKMLRDILENKMAYLACAIVMAIGLMTFISMSMAKDSLFYAKSQFYEEYHFADVFAKVKAMPLERINALENIEGVDIAEGRLVHDVRVVMPDMEESVYLRLISLQSKDGNKLNGVKLEKGVFPGNEGQQLLVADKFFEAHQLELGDSVQAIIEGKQVSFTVSGTGISPEYIYALKNLQSIAADPKTFEVAYVPYEKMEQLFLQNGVVNSISITLESGVTFEDIEEKLKNELERYELESLYGADDQLSNALLTEELENLEKMANSLPVVFLIIAAIILYIMLKRLVESQRGQIGTLKAFGYRKSEILLHYIAYGVFIGVLGGIIGGILGIAVSKYFIQIYQLYFNLPNLGAHTSMKYVFIGIAMAITFSVFAAYQGAKGLIKLQPAEAMHPAVPTFAKKMIVERIPGFLRLFNVQGRMALRNLSRNKNRSFFTFVGMVFTFSMMASFFSMAKMSEVMIIDQFTKVQKQDVKITFTTPLPRQEVLRELQHVDGVKRVEPFLEVPLSLKFLHYKKDVVAIGLTADGTLYNVFDKNGDIVEIPASGMLLSEQIADSLHVEVGDVLEFESYLAEDDSVHCRVEGIIPQYLGANVYMNQDVLIEMLGQGEMMTAALVAMDERKIPALQEKYRASKFVSAVEVRQQMIDQYNELLGSTTYVIWVLAFIAILTGFAIVYNSSIISLAERKRELASLRVMGMRPKEVMDVVSVEQWSIGFVGILAGIPLSFFLNYWMSKSMSSDLYTLPSTTRMDAFILAFVGTIISILISQISISRKVKQLDLVSVLKERE